MFSGVQAWALCGSVNHVYGLWVVLFLCLNCPVCSRVHKAFFFKNITVTKNEILSVYLHVMRPFTDVREL